LALSTGLIFYSKKWLVFFSFSYYWYLALVEHMSKNKNNELRIETGAQLAKADSSLITYPHSVCNWHSNAKVTYMLSSTDEYIPLASLAGLVILGAHSAITVGGNIIVRNPSSYSYIFLAGKYITLSGSDVRLVRI
jgi:hypothetical protein